jgi:cytoskeletal protein CcmA (bactofilin family)
MGLVCDMREIRDKFEGDLVVQHEQVCIYGMIAGNLNLLAGADVVLNGMVCGNVRIDGGKLVLNGMVDGDVINCGGEIDFHGRINGDLHRLSGITRVNPGAIVAR